MAEMLEAFGVASDCVDEVRARGSAEDCPVHADNWESLQLFLTVQTQWHQVAGIAGCVRTGLNYPAIETPLRLYGVKRKRRAALFNDLRVMEAAALEEFAAQRERRSQQGN
ncbi:DUF1799 domain-containing protein [Cupriavidus sp. KK10]|jgi:hypothetical protein|uniref:DUF1799 domain-containing protein n=1 Tax=Cupriavidus sp. KK10 TaxID=1478019 RepID=UPI001BA48DBC|nr:DUF1799 domain-containing protein [Cupriavidus sp. KK10]QUN29548.1 DUF1799 domain-containing protein [Cupriavidus sp. KK10]